MHGLQRDLGDSLGSFSRFADVGKTERPERRGDSFALPARKSGGKGRGDRRDDAVTFLDERFDVIGRGEDDLCVLRALVNACSALDTQVTLDASVAAGDADGLDGARSYASVAVHAVGEVSLYDAE